MTDLDEQIETQRIANRIRDLSGAALDLMEQNASGLHRKAVKWERMRRKLFGDVSLARKRACPTI